MDEEEPVLEVKGLKIQFFSHGEVVEAVKEVSFKVFEGKTLAIVGESGSGKSVSALALTRLLPEAPVCKVEGEIFYKGENVLLWPEKKLRKIRGKDIAYIFQDPCTSLNPLFTIGSQIAEAVKQHLPHINDVYTQVIEALNQVGIRKPRERYNAYPHELSGGMQQRVMIAMALACEPKILIADEPTTALDVTIQKQILDLLKELKEKLNMTIIIITHNFGIIKNFADEILVMLKGEILEKSFTDEILTYPKHPYTKALLACVPKIGVCKKRLATIDYELFK